MAPHRTNPIVLVIDGDEEDVRSFLLRGSDGVASGCRCEYEDEPEKKGSFHLSSTLKIIESNRLPDRPGMLSAVVR
jgi:hypothetical protein